MSSGNLLPICFQCARLRGVKPGIGWACDAFERGIPTGILASRHDHRRPHEGDGGKIFEPKMRGGEDAGFSEKEHPRASPGTAHGGQFVEKGGVEQNAGYTRAHNVYPKAENVVAHGEFSGAEKQALDDYDGAWDTPINAMLRGQGDVLDQWLKRSGKSRADVQKRLTAISDAFKDSTARLKKNVLLFRGAETGWKQVSKLKRGDVVSFNGFLSTSTNLDVAKDFAANTVGDQVIYQIAAGAGMPAINPGKAASGIDAGTDEILLDNGIQLKIIDFDRKNRTVIMKPVSSSTVKDRMTIATDPPVSQKQRRAMWAAASGHSNIGIPQSVGREFAEADPGGKLPEKMTAKDMTRGAWRSIYEGLSNLARFFGEEEQEPEHQEGAEGKDAKMTKGRAASVAFTTADGRVLLVRRGKDEKNYPGYWALPGGQAEEGEDFAEAARRECREEIGDCGFDGMAELRRVRTPGDFDHVTYTVPVKEAFEPKLNHEHDAFDWMPVTELPEKTHPGVRAAIDETLEKAQAAWIAREHGKIPARDNTSPESKWYAKIVATDRGRRVFDRLQKDMAPEDFEDLKGLLDEFFSEEARESEHRGQDGVILDQSVIDPDRQVIGKTPVFYEAQDRAIMAYDRASVRHTDDDGRLHIDEANICEARIDPYYGEEINAVMADYPDWVPLETKKKYRVFRDPAELSKPETIKSANAIPILCDHVATSAKDHKFAKTVGSTGTNARWEAPFIKNALVFWPQAAIDDIDDGSKAQLSPGYKYVADPTPGTWKGEPYDIRMKNIAFNHLAQVPQGRQGPKVVVPDADPDWRAWRQLADAIRRIAA